MQEIDNNLSNEEYVSEFDKYNYTENIFLNTSLSNIELMKFIDDVVNMLYNKIKDRYISLDDLIFKQYGKTFEEIVKSKKYRKLINKPIHWLSNIEKILVLKDDKISFIYMNYDMNVLFICSRSTQEIRKYSKSKDKFEQNMYKYFINRLNLVLITYQEILMSHPDFDKWKNEYIYLFSGHLSKNIVINMPKYKVSTFLSTSLKLNTTFINNFDTTCLCFRVKITDNFLPILNMVCDKAYELDMLECPRESELLCIGKLSFKTKILNNPKKIFFNDVIHFDLSTDNFTPFQLYVIKNTLYKYLETINLNFIKLDETSNDINYPLNEFKLEILLDIINNLDTYKFENETDIIEKIYEKYNCKIIFTYKQYLELLNVLTIYILNESNKKLYINFLTKTMKMVQDKDIVKQYCYLDKIISMKHYFNTEYAPLISPTMEKITYINNISTNVKIILMYDPVNREHIEQNDEIIDISDFENILVGGKNMMKIYRLKI
jgi:hypothetical protein